MTRERTKIKGCLKRFIFGLFALFIIANVLFFIGRAIEVHTWRNLQAQAEKLKPGMSMEQTMSIMGKPAETIQVRGTSKELFTYYSFRFPYLRSHRHNSLDAFRAFFNAASRPSEAYVEFDKDKLVIAEARPNYEISFDSKDWKKSTPARRHCMVNDLIEKYENKKLKKAEIINLLGKPGSYSKAELASMNKYIYYLDLEWGFLAIDGDYFIVEFDKNGRVKRMYIQHT